MVDSFASRGYRTIGVTSNIYFSRGQGFDAGFDAFYETRRPLNVDGLNPFSAVRKREADGEPRMIDYLSTFGEAIQHERPIASVGNFFRAVAMELDRRYDYSRLLPWHDDDNYGFLREADDRSEALLASVFERQVDESEPFFAFANLMGAHFPYQPTAEHLAAETDGNHEIADLRAIDPNISNSWVFLNEVHGRGIDDADLELVRAAYRSEVRTIDERIGRLLTELERHGLREETLIVITADHGEALGERDLRGERTMGHLDSLNEHLWTVPLLLVHPEIASRTVLEPMSLAAFTNKLQEDINSLLESNLQQLSAVTESVLFEVPANPYHASSYERYDKIPERYVVRETETHTVLGLHDDWAVAIDSGGEITAWQNSEERPTNAVPGDLVESCEAAVTSYELEQSECDQRLPAHLERQLEELGYL